MGAWGINHFENDSAMDWVIDFSENPSISGLEHIFKQVLSNTEYIEVDQASEVLAAGEVLAALKGKKTEGFPEELEEAISQIGVQPEKSLLSIAIQAIKKVLEESELQELWAEGDEFENWEKAVDDLLKRLQ